MSKKRSSRNTKSVKRSLKRKRGGVIRQDYRQGGHVKRVGVYNGGNSAPKPNRDDYPTGADYNTAMSNWYAAGGPPEPQQNMNTNQAQPRLRAGQGNWVLNQLTGEMDYDWHGAAPNHEHPHQEDPPPPVNNDGETKNIDAPTKNIIDSDNDGIPDSEDAFPNDATKYQEERIAPEMEAETIAAPDYDAFASDLTERQTGNITYSYDKVSGQMVSTDTQGKQTFHGTPEKFAEEREVNLEGYTTAPEGTVTAEEDIQQVDDYVDIKPPEGVTPEQMKLAIGDLQQAAKAGTITPGDYDAHIVQALKRINPALGQKPDAAIADEIRTLTEAAKAAKRDTAQEEEAKAEAAERPITRDYADAATTDEEFTVGDIDDPAVRERILSTITEEERELIKAEMPGQETDLEAILEKFPEIQKRVAQTGTFAKRTANDFDLAPEEEAATAEFYGADYTPEAGGTEIDEIPAFKKAAEREAQVQEAAQGIAAELGEAPSVDLEGREAITGTAPQGNAAQIGGVPTMAAAQMESVQGVARSAAAADMMAVVANMPTEITAAISEDPAEVTAQLDTDPDPEVTAALAALPEEALVSTQMNKLLEGMEEGQTPLWARPAVAQVEQMMAQRGLSVSTVGRDALFNAIIQSALPMAQSNAQALQQRAQQNLSNEQQANLASAQQKMQVRMQNLANRQTSASQTAQMAQQIRVQQGQFRQEAVMTTAAQRQQTELANAQMAQQRAQQESAQKQQAAISTLDSSTRMDLANLQAESMRAGKQLDADQQARLQTYQAQVNKVMRQADYQQRINEADLGAELQTQAINLNNLNLAARDTMTAEQQEELKNIDLFVDFKKTNAGFTQQMEMANLSNRQQMRLVELQDKVATDTANFTADNQFELAELTAKVQRSTRQAELNARLEEVNLDSELRVELAELSERNTTSRANMTAEQQMRLTNLNNLVDFRKTNAAMAQQMDMANMANEQQMEMAMLADRSATDAANMTEENRRRMASLSTAATVLSQNTALLQQADAARLGMEERVSLANLTHKNAADAQSMTAENNAELQTYEKRMQAGQLNAQLAQQMGLANLSNEQSAAMFNAQIDANMDMKQFDFNQQASLANSQFMQTMTLKDFDARQTSIMQNATAMANLDLAAVDQRTKFAITNANNFLQIDLANLSNRQQGRILDTQLSQQRLLSNQASINASRQFNATSENQINQFNESLANTIEQFNAQQFNSMEQFNSTESNRMEALAANNALEADRFNNQLVAQVDQFNEQVDLQRDQWNATNAQAVEQSNVEWRRKANTLDTAAKNAINQQNAQMAFNMSQTEQAFLWQQLRDEASYIRQSYENQQQRETTLYATALSNEAVAASDSKSTYKTLTDIISKMGD